MTKWNIDPAHSQILFTIQHLHIAELAGRFNSFELDIETNGDTFSTTEQVSLLVKADSIDTNNGLRDESLRSRHLFDTSHYKSIRFIAHEFEPEDASSRNFHGVNPGPHKLKGELTIKDRTKKITVDVYYSGSTLDQDKKKRAGFYISTTIKRSDFNLELTDPLPVANHLVGDEIRIKCNLQLVRQ
jgi:polyisoprenoid-binding protein YceI